MELHEYLFDVKLFAAVRVTAPTVEAAREAMRKVIDGMDPDEHWLGGFNDEAKSVKITEVSLSEDSEAENAAPVEIDGEYQ
jgi:hypothetical protein